MKHSNRSPIVRKPRTAGAMETFTIGIDLGDRRSHICVLDGAGETVREEDISTSPRSFELYFKTMPRAVVALEVGMHSRWASRVIQECGHDVIVANPTKVKLISSNDRKNDRVDARSLARLARVDRRLLFPIRHRSEDAQAALSVLRARDSLVRARTRIINCVRGLVKPTGVRLPASNAEGVCSRVNEHIPPTLRQAVALVMEQIQALSDRSLRPVCRTPGSHALSAGQTSAASPRCWLADCVGLCPYAR